MKTRMLCLILALLLLPFGASASEEPQAVRTDYTYFYMTVSITDETTGEYYGTTLEGGTIPGDEKSPEAMEIRQALIRQADAYAAGLLRPGTELADRATSADLKWNYTNTYTVENDTGGRTSHEDVYSSYYMIYSASIVSDGSARIDAVDLSVDASSLTVGGSIDPAFNHPTAAVLDADALYAVDRCAWTTETGPDAAPFSGAVRADADYYAMIQLRAKDRATFSENMTIRANGDAPAETVRIDGRTILIFVRFHTADSPVDDPGQWDRLPFSDVPEDAYFCEPVRWALEKGVTTGATPTTFAPSAPCTRAQVVTFLWRAAGSPAPTEGKNPFSDVAKGAYYYDAVLWAVEKGITTGTTATTFSPNSTCTRGQVVTFLWRDAGAPHPMIFNIPFADVRESDYFSDAVLWALEKNITKGTTETTFSPQSQCQRAHVVTFLFRAK